MNRRDTLLLAGQVVLLATAVLAAALATDSGDWTP
jgi:hypothetical protein